MCVLQTAMVGLDDSFDAVALRLEVVAIQGKFVIGLREALNAPAKAIRRNEFV